LLPGEVCITHARLADDLVRLLLVQMLWREEHALEVLHPSSEERGVVLESCLRGLHVVREEDRDGAREDVVVHVVSLKIPGTQAYHRDVTPEQT